MYKWTSVVRRVLRLLYQFCILVLLLNLVFGLFKQPIIRPSIMLYILGMLCISYIARERMSRGISLLLIHVIMGAATFFLISDIYFKWVIIVVIAEFYFDGLYYLHSNYTLKRISDIPWMSVALGIAITALGIHYNSPDYTRLGYILPIITIIIFLISLYIEGLENYIAKSKTVSGAPLSQIISVNTLIILGIIFIIFLTILLGYLLHFEVALEEFLRSILLIIKLIFVVVLAILGFIFSLLTGGRIGGSPVDDLGEVEDKAGLLANIINFLFVSAFIIIAVYFTVRFLLFLIRFLISKQDRRYELLEDISTKKKKAVVRERIIKEDRLRGSSPAMKVRRIYKRRVKSYKDSFKPERSDTTGDIKKLLDIQETPPDAELTSIYDAVRYGDYVPDGETISKLRKM